MTSARAVAFAALALCIPALGFADTSAGDLEWETTLETIRNSISGPVGFSVAVIGMVAAGSALIFGGEIGGVLKNLIGVVFAACLILLSANVLTTLFPAAETLPKEPVSSAPVHPGRAATTKMDGGRRPEHGVGTKTAHLSFPERGRAPCCG